MELEYKPILLPSLFTKQISLQILKNKIPFFTDFILKSINWFYQIFQNLIKQPKIKKQLTNIKKEVFTLSKTAVFDSKLAQMHSLIELLKK